MTALQEPATDPAPPDARDHHIDLPDLTHLHCRAGNHPPGTACAATGVHHGVRFSIFWWPAPAPRITPGAAS